LMSISVPSYRPFLEELRRAQTVPDNFASEGTPLLDGAAATELRRLVSLPARRRLGAFFTPERLADRLAEPLTDEPRDVVVFDPACGAGDLLIAASRSRRAQYPTYSTSLYGRDIVSDFVEATEIRMRILGHYESLPHSVEVQVGNGLDMAELPMATHVLMNPPFTTEESPPDIDWSMGKVNSSALFLMAALKGTQPGTMVRAILPDVLRSGSIYRKWREEVDGVADVRSLEIVGRFDKWTDVDVFVLGAIVGGSSVGSTPSSNVWLPPKARKTVGDRFDVRVGAVVNNRDPKLGPWRPYLTAKALPTWEIVDRVMSSRRFRGSVVRGPFVVVTRTSRPGDRHRARAVIVADSREVAVDNHLVALIPKEGGLEQCLSLIKVLRSKATSQWLDSRIRCRHLTVGAIAEIPWKGT
jgi:hypothetical protein